MAQPKRRRKKRLHPKFVLRRFFLFILVIAAAGGCIWYILGKVPQKEPTADPLSVQSPEPEQSPSAPEPLDVPADQTVRDIEPPVEEDWRLLLVNPTSPLPEGYEPDLETIVDIYRVDQRIADNVRKMFAQAKEDGINLMICSAYRSVEKQQDIFAQQIKKHTDLGKNQEEAEAEAALLVARPGTSEHHTGLAVDIVTPTYQNLDDGFAETPAFDWLSKNAYKFGFVLRYPHDKQPITSISYEPWHYRFVGEEHAAIIWEKGICLEEYLVSPDRADKQAAVELDQTQEADSADTPAAE